LEVLPNCSVKFLFDNKILEFYSLAKEVSMKKIASLSILLLFASAAFGQAWFKGTLDEALAKAKSEKKLVLIDFYSSG
jgi:hypothetical protein